MLKCLNVKMKRGFTLLEVIIAIFIVLIGVSASLALITRTVAQMNLFSSQLIASYLTQEGIEIVRNIRDTNWLEQAAAPNSWDEGLACSPLPCQSVVGADYTATAVKDPESEIPPRITSSLAGQPLCIDAGFYKYIDAGCTGATLTKFTRKITIVPTATTLTVTVETTWTEKGKTNSHKAQEVLYNWK